MCCLIKNLCCFYFYLVKYVHCIYILLRGVPRSAEFVIIQHLICKSQGQVGASPHTLFWQKIRKSWILFHGSQILSGNLEVKGCFFICLTSSESLHHPTYSFSPEACPTPPPFSSPLTMFAPPPHIFKSTCKASPHFHVPSKKLAPLTFRSIPNSLYQ